MSQSHSFEFMEIVDKTNIFHDWTNNSNNFHEFRETSGARVLVWKIMEIVGKTNIFHDWFTENIGKTNNFHDFRETP